MKLNLGCADRHLPGYVNVDLCAPADQIVDLNQPWPWPDSSIEEIQAHDIAEHIGGVIATPDYAHPFHPACANGRIHFMNELHRVLVPSGRATVIVPSAARGVGFITDPTHVTPWCLSLFKYFQAGAFAHQRLSKSYGITAAFSVVKLVEVEVPAEDPREKVWKIEALLEAVK